MLEIDILNIDAPMHEVDSFGHLVQHSETGDVGLLVGREVQRSRTMGQGRMIDNDLAPGIVYHCRTRRPYTLMTLAVWVPLDNQLGVYYIAHYLDPSGMGPHWFRPLHTPDRTGWLDPVDGGPRFERP